MNIAPVAAFVARSGVVLLFFPFSALNKVFDFKDGVKQAEQDFHDPIIARIVLVIGLTIEVICSLGIITGVADRISAVILTVFCLATALLYKQFWAQGDFWSNPTGKGRNMMWEFLKNVSLGAGILLIAVGTDGSGVKPFLDHPLQSSHPYSSE